MNLSQFVHSPQTHVSTELDRVMFWQCPRCAVDERQLGSAALQTEHLWDRACAWPCFSPSDYSDEPAFLLRWKREVTKWVDISSFLLTLKTELVRLDGEGCSHRSRAEEWVMPPEVDLYFSLLFDKYIFLISFIPEQVLFSHWDDEHFENTSHSLGSLSTSTSMFLPHPLSSR